MSPKRLLAKSYDTRRSPGAPPDYALLVQHSRDVAAACAALAEAAGPAALESAALPASDKERFARTLCLNGWAQDLGKANSHFQAMVTNEPDILQLIRHEAISGLLLWRSPLRRWLEPCAADLFSAVWGAVGHHRKFDSDTCPAAGVAPLTVYVTHDDFHTILTDMAGCFGLPPPPRFARDFTLGASKRSAADESAGALLRGMINDFEQKEGAYEDEAARRFLSLVKGFGIAADVVASAIAKRGEDVAGFVSRTLKAGLDGSAFDTLIRRWAWDHAEDDAEPRDESRLPSGFKVRPFQEDVATSNSYLTLAEAGCGSGKSLAAYLWAQRWCERRAVDGFRLFFCLPTTGTTTEHFKDYALEAGISASLMHSRAAVDLETIAATADQEEQESPKPGEQRGRREVGSAARAALAAEREKLESLALWETPLAVTTADTVLGLMANARRALCALPAIVRAAVVFDEIHAFDDQLFGHLLLFLKHFPRLPVLLMTASLPEERRRAISSVRPDLHVVPGPPELQRLERYRLAKAPDEATVWAEAKRCLEEGGKVLWVRNRVDWANQIYTRARAEIRGAFVDVYHSRLRYKDRSDRHRRVIDQFKKKGEAALLVATQVAEMSLDLSADLLVTDEAPIPSLIQRLGRLNRRATAQSPGTPKLALVSPVHPGDELPYSKEDLKESRDFRDELGRLGRPLSQADLSTALARRISARALDLEAAEQNAWFFGVPGWSGIWRTRPGSTRGEATTTSVVLQRDVEEFRTQYGDKEPPAEWLRRHEVSIPIRAKIRGWERLAGLYVAPDEAISYDYDDSTKEGTGAQWRES